MLITDKSQFPTFEDALMPILQTYGDWQERLLKNAKQEVYKKFFSNYSLEVHSSNKTVPTILDRIDRSHYYLYAWKYLDKIGYWKYKISQKWLDYLKTWKVLTHKYLSYFLLFFLFFNYIYLLFHHLILSQRGLIIMLFKVI